MDGAFRQAWCDNSGTARSGTSGPRDSVTAFGGFEHDVVATLHVSYPRPMFSPDHYGDRVPSMAPYAAAMRAYQGGRHDAGIRLRSSLGEDEVLPAAVFFRDDFFPFEDYALDLARGHVLDLGAGVGPHALELQRRGLDILAVENCGPLVDIMTERGVKRAIRRDFRWWRGPRFDTALMLMNGVGPTGTLPGLRRFLASAGRFLASGGQLLVDSAAAVPEPAGDGAAVRWPDAGEYPGQAWIDLEFDGVRGRPFRELYTDVDTLRAVATDVGWTTEVAFEAEGAFLLRLTGP